MMKIKIDKKTATNLELLNFINRFVGREYFYNYGEKKCFYPTAVCKALAGLCGGLLLNDFMLAGLVNGLHAKVVIDK